jgi:hypothetical protein
MTVGDSMLGCSHIYMLIVLVIIVVVFYMTHKSTDAAEKSKDNYGPPPGNYSAAAIESYNPFRRSAVSATGMANYVTIT